MYNGFGVPIIEPLTTVTTTSLSIKDATPLTIGDAKILKDFTLFGSVNSTL